MSSKEKGRSAVSAKDGMQSTEEAPTRVTAIVVAIENYRRGELPSVAYAHADADAFADALRRIYPAEALHLEIIKDEDATLTALKDIDYTLKNLEENELFIFYYAGHGFHGSGQNRLSAYDTNRFNIRDTTFSLQKNLLQNIQRSGCRQALIFVDACAEDFAAVVDSRDVIAGLMPEEVQEFLDSNWYCGVFLSCSPQERSYPDAALGHGIWTHFLIEALVGRDEDALRERWLTDTSLRDYLRKKVPQYISRNTKIKAKQTPQAIISSSGSFRIRHIEKQYAVIRPANEALADIKFNNLGEYLEGVETGNIRSLREFGSNHRVPEAHTDSANNFCKRLLDDQVKEEIQELYEKTLEIFGARRKEVEKGEDYGAGDLAHEFFRYSIDTGQNASDHTEFVIHRTLELRDGWEAHRDAIEQIFDCEFDYLTIAFDRLKINFDKLVETLEDVRETHGGTVKDDDRTSRVTYSCDNARFTFDLRNRTLKIRIDDADSLSIVDGVKEFQLGNIRTSPMLNAPK